jgi:hypothetical protein
MNNLFNQFLNTLKPTLQQAGFSQSHSNFRHQVHNNWALINFQRSSNSTAEIPHFTVNLGVYSSVLARVFRSVRMRTSTTTKPSEIDCHWRVRIGDLLPQHQDVWWTFNTATIQDCLEEIQRQMVSIAIPALQYYSSDVALHNLWASGSLLGVSSQVVRLEYLSLLGKIYGTDAEVERWLDELERIGGNKTRTVMEHALVRL